MSLKAEIQNIAAAAGMEVGVAVWHIESDVRLDVNGDVPFPMASTFKIPILAYAGHHLPLGEFYLEGRLRLNDAQKSLGSGILPYFENELRPTVRDLLTLMIIISDNTATDMMLEFFGGPAVIEEFMHQIGLTGIYFKLNCKDLLRHLFPAEVAQLPLEELIAWSRHNDIRRDSLAFSRGADNNVSTANEMNRLLHMMYTKAIFEDEAHGLAFDILLKQQFNVRLSRFLPLGTKVAHKTGTIGGIRNDSGVIYIDDANHVIVTVFTEWDEAAVWNDPAAHHQRVFEVETAMGSIGRAVYDAFGGG